MFSKSTFALFAILAAAANAAPGYPTGGSSQQCSSGVKSCCKDVKHTKDIDDKKLAIFGLLDIVASVTGHIATDCSPILGGGCTTQTVCCQNNKFTGLINIGCTPIDIL